jgi:adenylate cyclase
MRSIFSKISGRGILIALLIVFFSVSFAVYELSRFGQVESFFLYRTVYPLLSRVVNIATDLKFKARGPLPVKNKIVVVHIDSPSLEIIGRWPWHRDVTALLIDRVFELGAKIVGLDMTFSEEDRRVPEALGKFLQQRGFGTELTSQFETDDDMARVIDKHKEHLVISWISETHCIAKIEGPDRCPILNSDLLSLWTKNQQRFAVPTQFLVPFDQTHSSLISFLTPIFNLEAFASKAKVSGFINGFVDVDGFIRKTPALASGAGFIYPSLALQMAALATGETLSLTLDAKSNVQKLELLPSHKSVSVNAYGLLEVNFRGPSQFFVSVPALEVFSDKDSFAAGVVAPSLEGKLKADIFKDALVFIGISAIGVNDLRQFPMEPNSPGIYGHANALDNILGGDAMRQEDWRTMLGVGLFCMMLGVGVFYKILVGLSAWRALFFFMVLLVCVVLGDLTLFFYQMNSSAAFLVLEIMGVFFVTMSSKYIQEENSKKFIKNAFSKYVSPLIVDAMLQNPEKLSLGGERWELSILFSDIRNFTTFSETLDSRTLVNFLNDYFGKMTHIVFDHTGTLDKYIGDAIMAFWGAPVPGGPHAFLACKAAVAMQTVIAQQKQHYLETYGIELNVGIGINTGFVNVGNMGSDDNLEYTVIGDQVNLASRVEGLTKYYGVEILVTRNTFDQIEKAGKPLPPYRVLDFVKVKGKHNAVELLQVFVHPMPSEVLDLFIKAQDLYRKMQWHPAFSLFLNASEAYEAVFKVPDKASLVFMERCTYFSENPPGTDWDGSWKMDSK